MGEDPEQLEHQIEATRARLGEDVDALEEKINPKKVAHRSVDSAREKAAEVKDKVVGAAGPLLDTAREKAAPLVEKATPVAESVKEKAAVRSGLDPRTADTRQVATAVAGDTWATVREQTRRNPLLVGGVAFALGVLLGR